MKKIILLASMVVVIVAQVFLLGQFFVNRYDIILGGDTFKFLVDDVDFGNAREKGYIEINLRKNVSGIGNYGIINIDENGFAELANVAVQKPNYGAYIESVGDTIYEFPFDKYYINPFIGYSKKLTLPEDYNSYIVVRIKDAKAELLRMMIDDKEVEKYCK